jgi:hypothetical protein
LINKLWKALTDWDFVPASEGQIRSSQLVVTQAWSRRKDGRPGAGNRMLAEATEGVCIGFNKPVFPQEEVAWGLPKWVPVVGVAGGSETGGSTLEWNTYAVAKVQHDYCRKHDITRVIVVAHPLHMNRALWVYRRLGLEAVPAPVSRRLCWYQDQGLVHPAFRRGWGIPVIWFRELLARWLFVLQAKV